MGVGAQGQVAKGRGACGHLQTTGGGVQAVQQGPGGRLVDGRKGRGVQPVQAKGLAFKTADLRGFQGGGFFGGGGGEGEGLTIAKRLPLPGAAESMIRRGEQGRGQQGEQAQREGADQPERGAPVAGAAREGGEALHIAHNA